MAKRTEKKTFTDLYPIEQLMKHAAIAYSNLWFRKDRTLYSNAKSTVQDTLIETLVNIASTYKVSRTLPKNPKAKDVKDDERPALQKKWETIASVFQKAETPSTSTDYTTIVTDVAKKLPKSNKGNPLSAASKLLWFRFMWPIKIYDTRAVSALQRMGYGKAKPTYAEFCSAWDAAFQSHQELLERTIATVGEVLCLTLVPPDEWMTFPETSAKPWFRERTFDQFLWLLGDSDAHEEVEQAIRFANCLEKAVPGSMERKITTM